MAWDDQHQDHKAPFQAVLTWNMSMDWLTLKTGNIFTGNHGSTGPTPDPPGAAIPYGFSMAGKLSHEKKGRLNHRGRNYEVFS